MNNEQFERRMEFIIEQQAQFSADILELKEVQKAEAQLWREEYDNFTDAMTTIVGVVGKLAQAQERTDEQLSQLTAKQAESDDRLNVFITVVERYISGNGRGATKSQRTSKPSSSRRQTKKPRKR